MKAEAVEDEDAGRNFLQEVSPGTPFKNFYDWREAYGFTRYVWLVGQAWCGQVRKLKDGSDNRA